MKLLRILAVALSVASPALAQVNPGTSPLTGSKGGTNNAFMQFTGPATSIKTYSLPNTSDTITTIAAAQTLSSKTLASPGMTGALTAATMVTPSSPAAGFLAVFADSGQNNLTAKNSAGSLFVTVNPAVAVANQFVTNLAANGTLTTAQPSVSNISGFGTGVATALGVNIGTAGSPIVNGGALGTPSSGVATNLTGTAASLTAGNATLAATVTTNANLTGNVTSVGNATTLAAGSAAVLNSGTLLAARMPALTGDVTTTVGTVATTLAAGSAGALNSGTLLPARTNGHMNGTATNDNAAAGEVGEYFETSSGNNNANATVTMTIAAPAVVTWTTHKFTVDANNMKAVTAVKFTTTGALPTGVVSGTTYYLHAIDANTFNISTTVANAIAGTYITTTGSQSGTHTGDIRVSAATSVSQDVAAMSLPAGDYEVGGQLLYGAGATTTVTYIAGNLTTTTATLDRTAGRRLSFEYGGSVLNQTEFTVFGFAPVRFSLASQTTLFLVQDASFATSTLTSAGSMRLRRAR